MGKVPIEQKERYLTEKETSTVTAFKLPTLRNHRHRGVGIPYVKVGRSVRYRWGDIINYMESKKIKTDEL
jgi:predicted DNA-binding transcriptional regulator AlpA